MPGEKMTTKAGVGFSQVNSREVGIEATQAAMTEANVERCDLVILFAGTKHDPVLLREGVRSRSSFFTATMKFSQQQ
jgi:hypothetical protein